MSLIKGIHHVSMKCSSTEEYEKTIDFYKNILGIPVTREWQAGIMLDTGNGIVEIFNDGDDAPGKGVIRHFAFATDDVDAISISFGSINTSYPAAFTASTHASTSSVANAK